MGARDNEVTSDQCEFNSVHVYLCSFLQCMSSVPVFKMALMSKKISYEDVLVSYLWSIYECNHTRIL